MYSTIRFKVLDQAAKIPKFAHDTDAGMDLVSIEEGWIQPGEWKLIGTGLAMELPQNTEAQVRPRSGLAWKHGVTVLNAPGTIDEDYRGEIKVMLINLSKKEFLVTVGMRIAQMVIKDQRFNGRNTKVNVVEELSDTKRGEGGFGSTGTA